MAVQTFAGVLTMPAVAGLVTYTGLGFKPKAVIFTATNVSTINPSGGQDCQQVIGAAIAGSPAQQRAGAVLQDQVIPSDAQAVQSDQHCLILLDQVPSEIARARLAGMEQDGFRLSWENVKTDQHAGLTVAFFAIGGTDITHAAIATLATPAAIGSQAIDVDFDPDLIVCWALSESATGTLAPTDATQAGFFGFGDRSARQGCSMTLHTDAANPTVEKSRQRTDKIVGWCTSGGVDAEASLVRIDAQGWTLNWTTVPGAPKQYFALALKGCQAFVGSTASRTSNGSTAVTGVGFTPVGTLFASGCRPASASTQAHAHLALGAASSSSAVWSFVAGARDNQAGSYAASAGLATRAILLADQSTGTSPQATMTSFDADGFTLAWTGTDATAREVLFAAIGSAVIESTSFDELVKWPDAQFVGLAKLNPGLALPADRWTVARSYAAAVLADGPVGYWRLNESSGSVLDLGSVPSNGSAGASITRLQTAPISDPESFSYDFDGTATGDVQIPHVSGQLVTALTIEAWITPATLAAGRHTFVGKAGGTPSYKFQTNGSTLNPFVYYADGTNSDGQISFTLSTATRYHVVMTHDGVTTRLYVNGAFVGSFAKASNVRTGSGADIFLGTLDGSTEPFDGLMGEVAIYGRALQAWEVADHYLLRTSPWKLSTAVWTAYLPGFVQEFKESYRDLVIRHGARVLWRLNDASGSIAADEAFVNNAPGSYVGGVTLGGYSGFSDGTDDVALNGSTGYILVGDIPALRPTTRFSYECWITPTNTSAGTRGLISKDGLGVDTSGSGNLYQSGAGLVFECNNTNSLTASSVLTAGALHHVVVTYASGTARIYVNGALRASGAVTALAAVTTDWLIGRLGPASTFFNGDIKDVAIYLKDLSADQVAEHYAAATQAPRFRGGIKRTAAGFEGDGIAYSAGADATAVQNYPSTWYWSADWLYVRTATDVSPSILTAALVVVSFYVATKGIVLNETASDATTGLYWHPWIVGGLPAIEAARADLLSGAKITGGGPLALANGHGFFHGLVAGYVWRGRRVDLFVGGNYNQGRVELTRAQYVYWQRLAVNDIQANDQQCVLQLVDANAGLNVTMPTTVIGWEVYPNALDDVVGTRVPVVLGQCSYTPPLVDSTSGLYLLADATVQSLTRVVEVWIPELGADGADFVLNPAQWTADLTACTLTLEPGLQAENGAWPAVMVTVQGEPDIVNGGYLKKPGAIGKFLLKAYGSIPEADFDNDDIDTYDEEAPTVGVLLRTPRLLAEVLASDGELPCLERTGLATWYQRQNGQWTIRPWDPTYDQNATPIVQSVFTRFEPQPVLQTLVGATRIHHSPLDEDQAWATVLHSDAAGILRQQLPDSPQEFKTYLVDAWDATVLAQRLQFIAGTPRLTIDFALRTPLLARAVPGDKVLVSYDRAPVTGEALVSSCFEIQALSKRITEYGGLEVSGVLTDMEGVGDRLRQIDASNTVNDWADESAANRRRYLFISDDNDYIDPNDPDSRPGDRPHFIFW